jgi:hypothetical protein
VSHILLRSRLDRLGWGWTYISGAYRGISGHQRIKHSRRPNLLSRWLQSNCHNQCGQSRGYIIFSYVCWQRPPAVLVALVHFVVETICRFQAFEVALIAFVLLCSVVTYWRRHWNCSGHNHTWENHEQQEHCTCSVLALTVSCEWGREGVRE